MALFLSAAKILTGGILLLNGAFMPFLQVCNLWFVMFLAFFFPTAGCDGGDDVSKWHFDIAYGCPIYLQLDYPSPPPGSCCSSRMEFGIILPPKPNGGCAIFGCMIFFSGRRASSGAMFMLLLQNGTWHSSSQRRVLMFLQNAVQSLGHLAFFFPRVVQSLELLAFFILTAGTRHSTVQQWLFMLFLRYALLFNGGHPSSHWWVCCS